MSVELKPCPFCGSTFVDGDGWISNNGTSGPSCINCGATAESIELWNTRAEDTVKDELLEALKSVLECFEYPGDIDYQGIIDLIAKATGGE